MPDIMTDEEFKRVEADLKELDVRLHIINQERNQILNSRANLSWRLNKHKQSLLDKASVECGFYRVIDGDTLSSICLRLYGSANKYLQQIVKANNLESSGIIYAGQILRIPKHADLNQEN